MKHSSPKILNWLKSPYILFLILAAGIAWLLLTNGDNHFVTSEKTNLTFNKEMQIVRPGETEPTNYPAGAPFRLLAYTGNNFLLEDEQGVRMVMPVPSADSYSLSGSKVGMNRHIEWTFDSYMKADDPDAIAVGQNIDDFIKERGDFTEGNPLVGYYEFKYIVPVINGVRYESGIALHTDENGVITSGEVINKDHTSSNLFTALPFFDTIVSWNLVTHGVNKLYDDYEVSSADNEKKGFLSLIMGWIWDFIVWILKLGLLIVILAVVFIVPAMAICSVTGPMIYIKSIPTSAINVINLLFAIPVLYITLLSMTDYFHSIWWIMFPIFVAFVVSACSAVLSSTSGRRCPKCRAVDSIKSNHTKLDTRVSTEYETVDHESDTLKHKGYNVTKGREEWTQDTYSKLYRITTTETDWRVDWHCEACGDSGTSTYTKTDKKRELVRTERGKNVWTPK